MAEDIRRGTVEKLWTNIEVAGRDIWAYAHFKIGGVPARLRLGAASSRHNASAPAPFAEGELIIASGKMRTGIFSVRMAYLPERQQTIPPSSWIEIPLGTVPIIMGLPFLSSAIKFHAKFEICLFGLMSIAAGVYIMITPFIHRAMEKRLKAAARTSG